MADRVSLSGEQLELRGIAEHHRIVRAALKAFYDEDSADPGFTGRTSADLRAEMQARIAEDERSGAFSLLAATEAIFRIDYVLRVRQRKPHGDALARRFRECHRVYGDRPPLDEVIFEEWVAYLPAVKGLIGDLRGAFRYRHWLAHGRYWTPKLGRKYGYDNIYHLALLARQSLPFVTS